MCSPKGEKSESFIISRFSKQVIFGGHFHTNVAATNHQPTMIHILMVLQPSVQKLLISLSIFPMTTNAPFGYVPLSPNLGSLPVDIISLIQSPLTSIMLVYFNGSCAVVTLPGTLPSSPPSWSANIPILDPSCELHSALFDFDLQVATQYVAEISGWFQDQHCLEAFLHLHSYLQHPSGLSNTFFCKHHKSEVPIRGCHLTCSWCSNHILGYNKCYRQDIKFPSSDLESTQKMGLGAT